MPFVARRFRPLRAWMRAAVLAGVCLTAACGRERRDPTEARRALAAEAHAVIGNDVREAVAFGGGVAALAMEPGVPSARWLVLLDGAEGRRRVRARLHTYVPVANIPGRFGTADADGDGKPEAFAIGTTWTIGGAAIEVLVSSPAGEAFRYEITQEYGHDAGATVWTPNLRKHPALLAWMAAAAHRVLPALRREGDSLDATTPFMRDAAPLTPETALEAARQRLGWGVKVASPFGVRDGRMGHNVAVLYAREERQSADRIAILSGGDYVYDVFVDQGGVLGSGISDHAGRFGVVDVDRDGTPEIFEVNDASGSGAWGMGAALIDAANGDRWEAYTEGSWDAPVRRGDFKASYTGDVAAKRGARAFLDSVLTAAVLLEHGSEDGLSADERRARQAEDAWNAPPAAARTFPGPVPGEASCTVAGDAGVDWVVRLGGVWAHDRARDQSRVVYHGAAVTSVVAGKRFLWTNVVAGDTADHLALLAIDRRDGRVVRVPAPELGRVVTPWEFFTLQRTLYHNPACAGECATSVPLRVADGTLVLDETYLTLPAWVAAGRELEGARGCTAWQ